MKDIFQVIDTIQLSEKATILSETNNEYVFKVHPDATKIEIRNAVSKLFKIPLKEVKNVRTCNYSGKKKRERRADFGRTKKWKKAFVRLGEEHEIDLT